MEKMDWKNQISGCFGDVDKIFAGHPLDEQRAKKLRSELKQADISNDEIIDGFVGWLYRQGVSCDHLVKQMSQVKAFSSIK